MKTFEYRGYDQAGRMCRGFVEALTVKDAREKLAVSGTLAEHVATTSRNFRFPVSDRILFYREMNSLLSAGVPMAKALDILVQAPENDKSRLLIAGIRDAVKEGAALSAALSQVSDSVGSFELAILQAAERSADMESMLDNLASFLEKRERLRDHIVSALIYPGIVFVMGILVAVVMMGFIIPRAHEMLLGANVPIPAVTKLMMLMGDVVAVAGIPMVFVAVAGVFMLRRRLKNDHGFLLCWDRMLYRLPLFGRGYEILVNLRFAQTFAMLIRGGVSVIDGILLAGRASGSPWVRALSEKEAESVRHGSSVSEAVARIPPIASSLPGLIRVGEAGGGIDRLLDSAAVRYQNRWDHFADRFLSALEPVLILIIGGFVLMVTLSVLLPVISLSQGIAG